MVLLTQLSQSPNGILIGSAVFAQLIRVPNKQTDTQTTLRATSVAIGLISCTACRRCGLIITTKILLRPIKCPVPRKSRIKGAGSRQVDRQTYCVRQEVTPDQMTKEERFKPTFKGSQCNIQTGASTSSLRDQTQSDIVIQIQPYANYYSARS